MQETETRPPPVGREPLLPGGPIDDQRSRPPTQDRPTVRLRAVPLVLTLFTLGIAGVLAWAMWQAYMVAPWTRDGTVRAYVAVVAPQVSGQIVNLGVEDNEFVHKGDVLAVIDPTDYRLALQQAQAAAVQARVNAQNAERDARRRETLSNAVVSPEEKERYATLAQADQASVGAALARVEQARVNVARTIIRSPVNGYVTNLLAQQGDYATVGRTILSVVDSESFWVDAYFEETSLDGIHIGEAARIKLMGYPVILRGHVQGIARGIAVANTNPAASGLAQVNPIFTWVRLAQRIPVRIEIDHVPAGVNLVAGETASVQLEPGKGH